MIISCILFDFYNFGDKLNTMEKLFTIGDTVFVLDDSLEGKVVGFHATYIQIETNDGFVLEYLPNELIKKNIHEPEIKFNKSVDVVLSEKEPIKKKGAPLVRYSKKEQPIFEVDLHLEKITSGKIKNLTNFDKLSFQLEEAKRAIDFAITKRYSKVVLIHGVGEGVLKSELEYLVKRYENITIQEANYNKYGLGAMELYIKQN